MADDNLFFVQVVAPERVLLADEHAEQVIMRTADGDITFLNGHTPLVGAVEPCVVRVVHDGGDEEKVAVHGGFVQVEQHADEQGTEPVGGAGTTVAAGTRVTVLASVAELAEEIDAERARVALESAQARVTELTAAASGRGGGADEDETDTELVDAEAAVRRAEVRLEATGAGAGVNA